MDDSQTEDISQICIQENKFQNDIFSKIEVRIAIFPMKHNLASGADGFAEFYQVFWNVIKEDLSLFHDFHKGSLPVIV